MGELHRANIEDEISAECGNGCKIHIGLRRGIDIPGVEISSPCHEICPPFSKMKASRQNPYLGDTEAESGNSFPTKGKNLRDLYFNFYLTTRNEER